MRVKKLLFAVALILAASALDADNLYMAGRNISGDFYAHASYRVTGSSVALGEAVGKAVAGIFKPVTIFNPKISVDNKSSQKDRRECRKI